MKTRCTAGGFLRLITWLPVLMSGASLAQVGNVTLYPGTPPLSTAYSVDLRTATITNLYVENHGSTTSGVVTVELWASTVAPSIGGSTNHFLMGSYVLGTVDPGANHVRSVQTTGPFPLSVPNPGVYWLSYALTEDRGAGPILEFILTASQTVDVGGPFYTGWLGFNQVANDTLYFARPLAYSISGTNASLQVDLIQNSLGTTAPIRLELWASIVSLHYEAGLGGDAYYRLLSKDLAPLAPGGAYHNVDTGVIPFVQQPPAGTYWISAMLISQGSDGKYYVYSLYDFPNPWTSSGTAPPVAAFSFSPAAPNVGQMVTFTDGSMGGTSWQWSFGDNATSSIRNPIHTYGSAGSFQVSLVVSNLSGSNSVNHTVTVTNPSLPAPVAAFSFSPGTPKVGQIVSFADGSTGGTSWQWNFGDNATSSLQNPTQTYVSAGSFQVALVVSNSSGSSSVSHTVTVTNASLAYSYVLPSSAHVSGANGAFYTTDLMIANRGAADANVTIQFLGHDVDGRTGPSSNRLLASNRAVSFIDILSSMFGVTSGFGAIRVTSDSPSLKIIGQTSTPPPDGKGTFGQTVPASDTSGLVTQASPRSLIGLRQDAAFRTNVFLANAGELPAHVVLSLISADGFTFGSAGYDLAPLGMTQVSSVVTTLGAPVGTRDAVLVVSTTTAGAQVATYAAVIDNVTNDPRTVLP